VGSQGSLSVTGGMIPLRTASGQYQGLSGYKLYKPRCVSSASRNFFVERIINVWNFLPHTVDFSSLPKFKRSLNRVDFSAFLRYA